MLSRSHPAAHPFEALGLGLLSTGQDAAPSHRWPGAAFTTLAWVVLSSGRSTVWGRSDGSCKFKLSNVQMTKESQVGKAFYKI